MLQYITANPARRAFDAQQTRYDERDKRQRADSLDEAYRTGIAESLGPQQPEPAPQQQAPARPQYAAQGSPGQGAAPAPSAPATGQGPGQAPGQAAPQAPSPSPAAGGRQNLRPLLSRLTATPGGGEAAMGIFQEQHRRGEADEQRRTELQRYALDALAKGDTVTFNHLAPQAGIELPPHILADKELAARAAQGMLYAEQFYGQNPAQAQKFVQTYIQSGGNIDQGFAAAGTPTQQASNAVSIQQITGADGQTRMARLDARGNFLGWVEESEGNPLAGITSTSAAAPADVRTAEWLVQNGVARNAAEAWELVRQARQNPLTAATSIFRAMTAEQPFGMDGPQQEAWLQQQWEAAQRMAREMGGQGAGGVPSSPAAAGSAGPGATGAPSGGQSPVYDFTQGSGTVQPRPVPEYPEPGN